MAFRSFERGILFLILLIILCSVGLGWALFSGRVHLSILLGLIVCMEAVFLYYWMNRTHKEILFFFKALENDDTALRYTASRKSKLIDELHGYLNTLNAGLQETKMEAELREQYFSLILENLSSGLLVVSKTGFVNHINNEALRLLQVPRLTHIKALAAKNKKLYTRIKHLRSLETSEITIQERDGGSPFSLGLQAVEINLKGENVRIISIQDLSVEMEWKEIDDWVRLIRIMSHEIMNSLAPITSISTTLKEIWSGEEDRLKEGIGVKIIQTVKGLDAIAEQSEGLTTFFESYRILSRIPDPEIKEFPVKSMFEKLETLVIHNEENRGIKFKFKCDEEGLVLIADEQMITNVLLNLVKNASQALEETDRPEVQVGAYRNETQQTILWVRDNGPGIPAEHRDEIFMPFFTTRKKGTGVGLSYSRQVLSLHKGTIAFDSAPGNTEFRLVF
jgi:nitrogen fixation/metabolism regulation signal transduction histidine kinase